MLKAIAAAKLLVLLAAAFLLATLATLALRLDRTIRTANGELASLTSTKKQIDLTIKEAQYLILQAGLTANEARKASVQESAMLDDANARIKRTLDDLDRATLALTTNQNQIASHAVSAIDSVRGAVDRAQPAIDQTAVDLAELEETEASLNKLLSDPDISGTIANVQTVTGDLAIISTDGKNLVERYAHPSKKKLGFWAGVWAAVQIVHKLEPPMF